MVSEQIVKAEEGENEESPSSSAKFDVLDMPSKKADVSNFDIFCLLMSIATHIIDLVFDINVACHYLSFGQYSHFIITVLVILIPSFINNAISFRMRQQDREMLPDTAQIEKRSWTFTRISRNLLSIILQVAPLRRYWISLNYALRSRKCKKMEDTAGQRQYYLKMVKENQDIALITVFECFMETAPQQIVQLTILLSTYNGQVSYILLHQILSIVSSFISMGWAMANYHRSIRLAQDDKENIGFTGSVLQFVWHLLVTISRIVTFSTAFMLSVVGSGFLFLIHWILMTTWIITESHGTTEFCRNQKHAPHAPLTLKERFFSNNFACVLGMIYTFVYVNPDDNSTYFRYFMYYSLCIIENAIVVILWMLTPSVRAICYCYLESNSCYLCVLPLFCLLPYVVGVATMIVYYLYFHPSKRQKTANES